MELNELQALKKAKYILLSPIGGARDYQRYNFLNSTDEVNSWIKDGSIQEGDILINLEDNQRMIVKEVKTLDFEVVAPKSK